MTNSNTKSDPNECKSGPNGYKSGLIDNKNGLITILNAVDFRCFQKLLQPSLAHLIEMIVFSFLFYFFAYLIDSQAIVWETSGRLFFCCAMGTNLTTGGDGFVPKWHC